MAFQLPMKSGWIRTPRNAVETAKGFRPSPETQGGIQRTNLRPIYENPPPPPPPPPPLTTINLDYPPGNRTDFNHAWVENVYARENTKKFWAEAPITGKTRGPRREKLPWGAGFFPAFFTWECRKNGPLGTGTECERRTRTAGGGGSKRRNPPTRPGCTRGPCGFHRKFPPPSQFCFRGTPHPESPASTEDSWPQPPFASG